MTVDIETAITIDRPVAEVYDFAADPTNAPSWYVNIERATWETDVGLGVGAKATFAARFLGRRLEYTYEIIELEPGRRLVMRTTQGPFPMATSYGWTAEGAGRTRMTLRNHGDPAGFSVLVAPLMAPAMRRANRKDLAKLKALLEGRD